MVTYGTSLEQPPLPRPGLYQNWKGYLIFVTGHEEQRGLDGVRYTFLTGERAGTTEWRSLADFRRHPIGPEGPPRYRPFFQSARIVADPVTEVLSLFSQIYPEQDCEVVWLEDLDVHGACYFGSGWTRVAIRTDLTLMQTIHVLLHELAHVVTTHEADDHGPLFYACLENLENAWVERAKQLSRMPGLKLVETTNGQP